MLTDEKKIFPLVKLFISLNCDAEKFASEEVSKNKLKCYLKMDEQENFFIYDKDYSIKCIFDKNFLEEYFKKQPSYISLKTFDGSLILIKKYYFDVLFSKNINKTLSVRILLVIKDFEVDLYQKLKININTNIKPNINRNVEILEFLKIFFYNFTKEYINSFKLESENLEAKNFIFKNFHIIKNTDSERNEKKINTFIKILEKKTDNILINEDISINEKCPCLDQINILDENENLPEVNDNITVENVLKFDFKKFLNFNANINGDNNLNFVDNDIKNFDDFYYDISNRMGNDFLGKKRKFSDAYQKIEENEEKEEKKREFIVSAPPEMKNLFAKYNRNGINKNILDKYLTYKKFFVK